ncbi:MAG: RHS repeat protein [Bacteroidales bacterium]|nr:RHS repeat protein [Bacteroidales bacterium]
MKKLKIFLNFLFVFSFITIRAQNIPPNDPFKLQEILPKSPEAAGLGSYGNFLVNEYAGTPAINIPLYTVKIGDIEVPVSLSYNATGIRVNQEATYVGLGWNLIAGGCIIYEPVGGDERIVYGPTYDPLPSWDAWADFFLYITGGNTFMFNSIQIDHMHDGAPPYPYTEVLGRALLGEGEQDVYSANFLNYSFKFIIHPNDTHEPLFVGKKNKCLIHRTGTGINITYIITGKNGIKYYFEEREMNTDPGIMSPNCWYLNKIIDLKGNVVLFNYENYGSIYATPVFSEQNIFNSCGIPGASGKKRSIPYIQYAIQNLYLTQIVAKDINGNEKVKVDFNLVEGRLDINGTGARRLQDIIVTDKINNTPILHYFLENDSYFEACAIGGDYLTDDDLNSAGNHAPSQDNLTKRLKLVSFSKLNPNNQNEKLEEYLFTYDESHLLPYKTSFAQDFWGFYNGQQNWSTLFGSHPYYAEHTLMPDAKALSYILDEYSDIPGNFTIVRCANRGMSSTYATTAMLQSITYPTGGKTVFEFEPHAFTNEQYLSAEDISNFINSSYDLGVIADAKPIGGGLRIKTIKNFNEHGEIVTIKKYSYNLSTGQSSGKHLAPLKNYITRGCKYGEELNMPIIYGTKYMLSCNSYFPLAASLIGTNVGYDRIEIENILDVGSNGKEILVFENDMPYVTWDKAYFFEKNNGNLLNRYFLNAQNETIKVENFNYANDDIEMESLNVFIEDTYHGIEPAPNGISVQDRWTAFTYPNISFWNHITQQEIIDYYDNGNLSNITTYAYDLTNYCIEQITQVNSDNKTKYTLYKYPHDFSSPGNIYESMTQESIHRINPVIETIEYIYNTANQIRTKTNYSTSVINPANVENQIGNNATEIQLYYDKYDNIGNLLQFHRPNNTKDIYQSYIWGYNNTYPIAEVKNANWSDIFHTSFEDSEGIINTNSKTGRKIRTSTYYKSLSGLTPGVHTLQYWKRTGSTWSLQTSSISVTGTTYTIYISASTTYPVDEVRFFPSNALMTTYTYDPLVGMTSETDPNGKTTYYTYDSFGRLQYIKDMDRNTIQEYKYHYKE